jgi:hypothetical protein
MDDNDSLDNETLDDARHDVAESRTEPRGARILVVDSKPDAAASHSFRVSS